MSLSAKEKVRARKRRHERVRNKISGTPERPRLSVYRGLNRIYAQIIDDSSGKTLVALSDLGVASQGWVGNKTALARQVGLKLAVLASAVQIKRVVFDRGGYIYHGRVKALAEAAREGGLVF